MTITKYEDMRKRLRIRHELSLYYWGEGSIVEFREWPIYYLSKDETDIISICDGICSVEEVVAKVEKFDKKEQIVSIINELIQNRILILSKEKKLYKPRIYGERGKFYPKDITFELTNRCNYKCPFCYKNAKHEGEFLEETVIYDFMKILGGRLESVLLTGGEPLLHPQFQKILAALSEEAEVRIVSNGSLFYKLPPKVVTKLSSLQLSLYGTNREEYARITGNPNGLEDIKKSLELANACGIPTRLSAVLNERTIEQMEQYVITAIELGADRLNLDTAYLFGRELDSYSGNVEYKRKVEEFYLMELECIKKYHKEIKISMRTVNVFSWKGRYRLEGYEGLNCGGGSRKLVVSQNGKIRACECFPEELFDYGGIEILEKMIDGDFQVHKLCEGMKKFYQINESKIHNTEICTAITEFCKRMNIMIE